MSYKVVIPARMGSTRLPGKPLMDIAGKPMVRWVYEAAQKSRAEQIVVATDTTAIVDAVERFGGTAFMTRADHQSGTDRLQEVAELYGWSRDTIVVNLQGDEPLMPAAVIDQVAQNLQNCPEASVATLSEPITDVDDVFNPNAVKVVKDERGRALYFSRAPIPFGRETYGSESPELPEAGLAQRHLGIYAYRVSLLHDFVKWQQSPLEQWEKLEQLRVLANGGVIHVAEACRSVPGGIDTQADLQRITELLEREFEAD